MKAFTSKKFSKKNSTNNQIAILNKKGILIKCAFSCLLVCYSLTAFTQELSEESFVFNNVVAYNSSHSKYIEKMANNGTVDYTDDQNTASFKSIETQKEILIVVQDNMGNTFYSKVIESVEKGLSIVVDPYHNIPSGVYLVIGSNKNEINNKLIEVRDNNNLY